MTDLQKSLEWRYATQQYDTTKKVSPEDFNQLIDAARMAPSSFGLQPWKIVDVRNPETRKVLQAAAWGQTKITEADHILVLSRPTKMDEAYIEQFIATTAKTRGMAAESLDGFKKMLVGFTSQRGDDQLSIWMDKQVYILLGFLLETAAIMHIDTTPMEGFDRAKFDEILGLPRKGYQSVVLCAVGYRAKTDEAASRKKVRFSTRDILMVA